MLASINIACIYTYMNLDHPANCLTFNLLRAARKLARDLDAALSPLNLTAQQFTILAQLSPRPSLATSQLADLIGTERTTVTRNLVRLANRNLIEQDQSGGDKRISAWRLTKNGQDVFKNAMPLWRDFQARSLNRVHTMTPGEFIEALKDL